MKVERSGLPQRVSLAIVDADLSELLQNLWTLHPLSDSLESHHVADMMDCFHHRVVDIIRHKTCDEHAIDLQIVDGQGLQIAE